MDRLERIAGRVAHAVGSEQSPEQIQESASLVAELASEFEAMQRGAGTARTVLLVEPDPEERRIIRGMLRELGHAVLEAESSTAALEMCREYPDAINLMVTGVFGPDTTGRELAERAALMRPDLAVLYASAYEADDVLHYGMLSPHAVVLTRPVTAEALARGMAEVLEAEYAR